MFILLFTLFEINIKTTNFCEQSDECVTKDRTRVLQLNAQTKLETKLE